MDYERLHHLELHKGTQQYGETLTLSTQQVVGGFLSLSTKDLVRVEGTKFDLTSWRIYLSPWIVNPGEAAPAAPVSDYAFPAPTNLPGSLISSPGTLDNFIGMLYAKILWGAGGWQHSAYVDWPVRGCVLQVSGSFVQVAAAGSVSNLGAPDLKRLPAVAATIGPEPGGGDSARPATYTYPVQTANFVAGVGTRFCFSVPPFARAFTPLIDLVAWFKSATFNEIRIAVQPQPADIRTNANLQSWLFTKAAGGSGIDWPLEPFPLPGQSAFLPILAPGPTGAVVTVEIDDTAIQGACGMMFDLDL